MRDKLLVFCDARDPGFEGFPTTRARARDRWAAAFDDYISVIEEDIPRPPPPADSHPTILLSNVKDAFFGKLALTPVAIARTAAMDFAGAWQAAIAAITAGGTTTDSAGGKYVFASWINTSTLHDDLANALETLFSSPTTDVKTRIGEIASAFHDATKSLKGSVTYTAVNNATSTTTINYH